MACVMLKINPELWTRNGNEQFVILSLHDFEKIQELIEDAGLSRFLRRAKRRETGAATVSLAEMKRRLGITGPRPKAVSRAEIGSGTGSLCFSRLALYQDSRVRTFLRHHNHRVV